MNSSEEYSVLDDDKAKFIHIRPILTPNRSRPKIPRTIKKMVCVLLDDNIISLFQLA